MGTSRTATGYALGREFESFQETVFPESLEPVVGARRFESAATGKVGRYGKLVEPDKPYGDTGRYALFAF